MKKLFQNREFKAGIVEIPKWPTFECVNFFPLFCKHTQDIGNK